MKRKNIKIGKLNLSSAPRIVLVLNNADKSVLEQAKSKGADILELRADKFKSITNDYVSKTIKTAKGVNLPLIGTVRSKKEGGARFISSKRRLELFDVITPLVDAIDIELSSGAILKKVIKKAKINKKKVIVSFHDFKKTPSDKNLKATINKAKKSGADLVKIAVFANSRQDLIRLTELTFAYRDKNLITIALGKKGAVSRIAFPLIGSRLTYACLNKPFAPGQIPITKLKKRLAQLHSKV